MKIAYFADGPWSHEALDAILELKGVEIAFITPRADVPDPVLKRRAEECGIPFVVERNVNSPDFVNFVKSKGIDLCVSMSFNQILRKPILEAAPLGFINCHAGALPFYRGRNVLNWALINGEKQFGVTVHHVDEGIDTGDVILREMFPISNSDAYPEVLKKAYRACSDVLRRAIELIGSGKSTRTRQADIHATGFYCTRRIPGDEWIDWAWSSERIHNFVRGITAPGPGARTLTSAGETAVLRTALVEDAPTYIGNPGEVVGRDSRGVLVKTGDSFIRVLRIAKVGSDGELGSEESPAFRIGERWKGSTLLMPSVAPRKISVFGTGDHARVVTDLLRAIGGYHVECYVTLKAITSFMGKPAIKRENWKPSPGSWAVVAIGDNGDRERVVREIRADRPDVRFATLVHPSAQIGADVEIGEGSVVLAGVCVNIGTKIGPHCVLNTRASIDHDNLIDEFVTVAPGAVTGGGVKLHRSCWIGMGATLLQYSTIGENALVGAASLVTSDVPAHMMGYGVPWKKRKKRRAGDRFI